MHSHKHTLLNTHIRSHTHIHSQTHTLSETYTLTHSHTLTHLHTYTLKYTLTLMHSHTLNTQTLTHMHTQCRIYCDKLCTRRALQMLFCGCNKERVQGSRECSGTRSFVLMERELRSPPMSQVPPVREEQDN